MNFVDQLNRKIELRVFPPKRIISLVPSQTELLFDLGLDEEVVGITKFCVHPENWFRTKKRIGGTKQLNISAIKELRPQMIFANKEENLQEQVEELAKEFPVWISDIKNLDEAYEMIRNIGEVVGRNDRASEIRNEIKTNFLKFSGRADGSIGPRTSYLIWQNPLMTVGGDTFINDMLRLSGFNNIFKNKNRYPVTSFEELRSRHCELLFLSSEPFPFKQVHANEMSRELPNTKIILVDGEMFSWYGSRLRYAADYFTGLQELVLNS